MKYPNLISLVPEGEHFDTSAIGEGVWLSLNHLNKVEESLANAADAATAAAGTIEEHAYTIETLNGQIATLTADAATAKTANETQAARIVELEGAHAIELQNANDRIAALETEVQELGKDASGTGTAVIATADENAAENHNAKLGLLDPEHPVNQYAAMQIAAKNKKKL